MYIDIPYEDDYNARTVDALMALNPGRSFDDENMCVSQEVIDNIDRGINNLRTMRMKDDYIRKRCQKLGIALIE